MSVNTLSGSVTSGFSGTLAANETVQLSAVPAGFGAGNNGFQAWSWPFVNGTANLQVNEVYVGRQTIPASGSLSIDFSGSLVNPLNQTIAFTAIKYLGIFLRSADGIITVRVGPQGVANAWQGPFGGVGATDYEQVYDKFVRANRWAGWAVVNGASDILKLTNAGGVDVLADVLILGTK